MKEGKGINKKIRCFLGGGGALLTTFSSLGVGFASWNFTPQIYACLKVSADDVETQDLLSFNSKSGNASFSKYGFIDSEGQITDVYTFSYCFVLNQSVARQANYVIDDSLIFDFQFSNLYSGGKFIYLFSASYLIATLNIVYGGVATSDANVDYSENRLSSSVQVPNITDADSEILTMNLTLRYVDENSSKTKAYFEGLPSDADFSFRLSVEAKRQS